jgi:uncharacterized protein
MKETMSGVGSFVVKATYVFVLVAISIGLFGFSMYQMASALNDQSGYRNSFSVEGKAKRKVTLDTAKINLGVVLKDKTPVEVQKKATERYEKAIGAIKDLGIKAEDIQTQNYSVSSVYKWESNEIEGYEIRLSLVVIVRDTKPESELLSRVINAATESGFNSVNSMEFYLEDIERVQDELKEEAIADAKARAERESKLAGLKIGKVINMNSYNPSPYFDYGYRSYEGMDMVANSQLGMEEMVEMPAIQIQPGQTEIEVTVNIQYEIL